MIHTLYLQMYFINKHSQSSKAKIYILSLPDIHVKSPNMLPQLLHTAIVYKVIESVSSYVLDI